MVMGDVMLDEFIWGAAHQLSLEAAVPVVEVRRRTVRPGGAANAAANVAILGGQFLLGGVVGNDEPTERLRLALAECCVDDRGIGVDVQRVPTTQTRVLAHAQQVVRVDAEDQTPVSPEIEKALLSWLAAHIKRCDALVLSD